jgi:hypothetical protein
LVHPSTMACWHSAWDDAADGQLWAAQGDYASVDEGVA